MIDLSEAKKLRKALGITQKQLAQQAGVSQSMVAKIESGRLDPAYSKGARILDTLNSMTNTQQRATDVMNTSIISISPGDSIKKAIAKLKKYNISQMPVLENRSPVGLVSESILLDALMNGMSQDDEVARAMKDVPPVLTKDAPFQIITQLLRQYPMVLIAQKGKLKGHITKSDMLTKAFT